MKAAGGKIEDGPYPRQCGWLQPGEWSHIAVGFSKSTGTATLYMNGAACHNSTVGKGALAHSADQLTFSNFSGFIADVRAYDVPLTPPSVKKLHGTSAVIYNQTAMQLPSAEEIERLGLGWKPFPQLPGDSTMRKSWLNYDTLTPHSASEDLSSLLGARQIVWAGAAAGQHPTLSTAVSELDAALPHAHLTDFETAGQAQPGTVLIGTCADAPIAAAAGSACPVIGGEEAFALRVINNRLVIAGGGDAGVLYGAFAAVSHAQLGTSWDGSAMNADESPSTAIRLLNHWSVWRGNLQDAWMPARTNRSALPNGADHGADHEGGSSGVYDDGADRSDSIFSWADLKDGPNANSTARIREWARLLASVGINSLAPQVSNPQLILIILTVSSPHPHNPHLILTSSTGRELV